MACLDGRPSRRQENMSANSISVAFAAAVTAGPQNTAIIDGELRLSYSQLAAEADRIACWLLSRNISTGCTVGLYSDRSVQAIAAILGVLKAGACYVPMDTAYPPGLLQHIYDDSAPSAMLVQDSRLTSGSRFWRGEALGLGAMRQLPLPDTAPRYPDIDPGQPAYIMYTSGSTGRPKGVVVPHRAVLRLVLDTDFVRLGPEQTLLQLAPLSFDASTFELWGALLNGGSLAVMSDPHPALSDIAAAVNRHGVTTLWLTAGLFHLMVDHHLDQLRPLRQLLAGGDVLSPSHVVRALAGLPQCRLINGYGPTENTTFSCCYTVPRNYTGETPVPIGYPIRQTEALVLDDALQPVAPGGEGELYVGGAGLALGYLNRPELTAERFIAHPLRNTDARVYRTGDRVRIHGDGCLDFLGRVDRQVKINGKRVELDEIEARLRATGLVQDAAVTSTAAGTGRMIAAYVTTAGNLPVDLELLRGTLRNELPDYMIPASITRLPALPLSPTGKVDRARLPAQAAAAAMPGAPSANAAEAALIGVFQQVLARDHIGVDDNFFDLGATSLQLMEAHARIRSLVAGKLALMDLFQYPRIRALAAHMTAGADHGPADPAALSARERARRQQASLARHRSPGNTRSPS